MSEDLNQIYCRRSLDMNLRTLQEIDTKSDTDETLLEKVNNVFSLQPTVLGVGVNLNEIVRLYLRACLKIQPDLTIGIGLHI